MKRKSKVISLILCISIFASLQLNTSVFASDVNTNSDVKLGTQQDWVELRNEYLSGKRQVEGNQNRKIKMLRSANTSKITGTYPKNKGDILVCNVLLNWQDNKSWTGHAGIVYSSTQTIEAFPSRTPTVQFHKNDWQTRYSQRDLYGLKVHNASTKKREAAADYCNNRRSSAKCYNLLGSKMSSTWINCASLVYFGYRNSAGISISNVTGAMPVTPMSLVRNDQTTTIYTKF